MGLRAIVGISHIPVGTTVDWRTYKIPSLDWWSSNRAATKVSKDANGLMQSANVATDSVLYVSSPSNISPNATKMFLRFNCEILAMASNPGGYFLLLDTTIDPTVDSGRPWAHALLLTELPERAVGKKYFIDLCFNIPELTISRWVNNVKLADVVLPSSGRIADMIRARKFVAGLFPVASNMPGHRAGFKDIAISDDVSEPGNEITGRLGNQVIVPLTNDTVVGENWTSSSGTTLKADVGVAIDVAGNGAVSPVTPTPLEIKTSVGTIAGYSITGVTMLGSMQNVDGSSATVETSIKRGSKQKSGPVVSVSGSTMDHGKSLGCFASDVDNKAWTPEVLADTAFVITPR